MAVPREHGAWVMLLCSLGLGLWAGRPLAAWAALSVGALVVGGFVLQESWRRRQPGRPSPGVVALAATTGAAALALLVRRPSLAMAWPLLLGAVLWLAQSGRGRGTLAVQLLGVLGFALPAALGVAASSAADPGRGAALWLADALFYAGAVTNVRMVLTAPRRRRDGESWLRQPTVRHNVALGGAMCVLGLALASASPALAPPWLAAAWRVAVGLRWLSHPPALRRVGLWETAWTLWFTLWLAAAV